MTDAARLVEELQFHLSCYHKEGEAAPRLTSPSLILIDKAATLITAMQAENAELKGRDEERVRKWAGTVAQKDEQITAMQAELATVRQTVFEETREMAAKDCEYQSAQFNGYSGETVSLIQRWIAICSASIRAMTPADKEK